MLNPTLGMGNQMRTPKESSKKIAVAPIRQMNIIIKNYRGRNEVELK